MNTESFLPLLVELLAKSAGIALAAVSKHGKMWRRYLYPLLVGTGQGEDTQHKKKRKEKVSPYHQGTLGLKNEELI